MLNLPIRLLISIFISILLTPVEGKDFKLTQIRIGIQNDLNDSSISKELQNVTDNKKETNINNHKIVAAKNSQRQSQPKSQTTTKPENEKDKEKESLELQLHLNSPQDSKTEIEMFQLNVVADSKIQNTLKKDTAVSKMSNVEYVDNTMKNEIDLDKVDLRIVGGKPVTHTTYPTFVFNGCGGTLIRHDLVLTAAHCVPNFEEKPFVFVGTKNDTVAVLTAVTDYEKIPIQRIIAHPKWSWDTQQNDIAILKLACSSRMPIQQLNTNIHLPAFNDSVTVVGYGSTQAGGPYSDILRHVTVEVVDGEQCYYNYGSAWIVNSTMICAGTNTKIGGRDACGGDSGGPLFQYQYDTNGSNKLLVQVGIVSFGFGCGTAEYPGVYTRITAYQRWIQRIVQYYSLPAEPTYCTSTVYSTN